MSGIFSSAAMETGSIRAETGSLRPPRIDVFALPPLCSPSPRARATGRAVKLRECPFEVVLPVLVAASLYLVRDLREHAHLKSPYAVEGLLKKGEASHI